MEDVNLCVIAESSVTGFGARGGLQMCHPGRGICCLLCFESSISAFASLPEEEEDEFGNAASAPARGCPSVWPCIPKSPPHFPRSPCSLCSVCSQPSPLPDFHPVFCPLHSPPPPPLALCGLIPIFSTSGSLSCICHQSNMSLPRFSSQYSQSSATQARAAVPSHSHPCLSHRSAGPGLSRLHVLGNVAQ